MAELIRTAYGLGSSEKMLGLPSWASSTNYSFVSKIDDSDVTVYKHLRMCQLESMLRPVLQERFALAFHWEDKLLPVYDLARKEGTHVLGDVKGIPTETVHASDAYITSGVLVDANYRLIARSVTMAELVRAITPYFDRPILDETGLSGSYSFSLQLPRPEQRPVHADASDVTPGQDDDYSFLRENQNFSSSLDLLGLRLVARKTARPVLIVDRVEKPSPN